MKCKTLCALAAVLALSGCSLFQDEEKIINETNPITEKSVTTTAKDSDSNKEAEENNDVKDTDDLNNTSDTDKDASSNTQVSLNDQQSGNGSQATQSDRSSGTAKVQTGQKSSSQPDTSKTTGGAAKSNTASQDTSSQTPAKPAKGTDTSSNKTDSETYTVAEVISNPQKYMDMGTINVVGKIAQGIIGQTSDGTPIGPFLDLNSNDSNPTYIALAGEEVAGQPSDTIVCTGKVIHAHGIYMLDVKSYQIQ